MNILTIGGDPELLDHLASILSKEHYQVAMVTNGGEALRHLRKEKYTLLLYDITGQNGNALKVIKQIRAENTLTPLLILTPQDAVDVIADGLNSGANDYLIIPFSPPKLLVRVRVLLAPGGHVDKVVEVGYIQWNMESREVRSNGNLLSLTVKEYSILEFLLLNKNQAISRLTLTRHIWGDDFDANMSNSLDVHMKNLRKKLTADNMPQLIATVRGFGFRLDD